MPNRQGTYFYYFSLLILYKTLLFLLEKILHLLLTLIACVEIIETKNLPS